MIENYNPIEIILILLSYAFMTMFGVLIGYTLTKKEKQVIKKLGVQKGKQLAQTHLEKNRQYNTSKQAKKHNEYRLLK